MCLSESRGNQDLMMRVTDSLNSLEREHCREFLRYHLHYVRHRLRRLMSMTLGHRHLWNIINPKLECELYIELEHVEMDIHTFFAEVPKVASMATPLLWLNLTIISLCQGV